MRFYSLRLHGACLLLALLSFAASPAALACGEERAERLSISGQYDNDHDPQQNLGLYGGYCNITISSGSASGTGDTAISGSAFVFPGKVYTLSYEAQDMTQVRVYLTPVPGFDLYIDGALTNTFYDSGSGSMPYQGAVYYGTRKVELRPKNCGAAAGTSPGLTVGDVIWEAGIGRLHNGELAGKILIHEDGFTTGVFSRGALNYGSTSTDVDDIHDGTGLRQILAPDTFVNVTSVTGGVQLDFYDLDAVTGMSSGLYTFSGTPFVSYAITDDGTSNRIEVVKTAGNYTATTVADYNPSGSPTWEKTTAGATEETRANTTVSGDRVETVIIRETNDTVVRKTVNTYHTYTWGEELISKVEDPDGLAHTTTYAYHDSGADEGSKAKLSKVVYPDGSWVRYEYYGTGGLSGC